MYRMMYIHCMQVGNRYVYMFIVYACMQLQGFVNEAALITIANCSEIKCMPSLVPAQYKPQNPHKVKSMCKHSGRGSTTDPHKAGREDLVMGVGGNV